MILRIAKFQHDESPKVAIVTAGGILFSPSLLFIRKELGLGRSIKYAINL